MRTLRKSFHIAAATAFLLAGCNIADPYVGTGPIALGSAAKDAFGDYQAHPYPRYFAVAEDGSAYYYSYCAEGRCLRTPKNQVVRQCETYSEGIPCKIYASNGKVVWAKDI